ncbi:two-component system sensor histidine kinase PrrB [Streptomyces sp. SLBN-118]|uniref:sensor histidine kinase n=1 Tax=Streptomyces sp. SLBN-118 TaxID=2768454 RepID=UPI00114FF30B|nr:HAMP domain-containing sensor histidine kinase [Streptomyces sp. SLBN-118]TQK44334.1 two-component system sensor histidine kinase PrrB [Streptomyces sp. SLBN-118]
MRLSTRVALVVGTLVPLLVLAGGAVLLRMVANDLHKQQDALLRERASAVVPEARALLRAVAKHRPQATEQARQRQLFDSALDVGIRLTGPGGTVSGGPQPDASVPLPAGTRVPVTVRADGARWRVLSVSVTGAGPGGRGTLWLFSPDSAARTQLGFVRRRVAAIALLTALVSGLLAWVATTRAARPLRQLQQRASGLDPRTSVARLEHVPTRVTEVDDLAHTLRTVLTRYDEQAARTAEALATARSFAASASHELRNPLMSMGTNLDILIGHPRLPEAERTEVVEDLRQEHGRVLGLLVMLRALAEGDLVEVDAFGSVDLAEVVDAAAADVRRLHPGAAVVVRADGSLRVHGWEPGLRSAVDNLLVNALVHGRTGGRAAEVEVSLRRVHDEDGPTAVLTVDDRGPGIPAAARSAVFERFHRRPDSPGSGLGLTLVAQQTALHGGRITVQDRHDGPGTRFEVRLPLTGTEDTATVVLPRMRRNWLSADTAEPQSSHKGRSWSS